MTTGSLQLILTGWILRQNGPYSLAEHSCENHLDPSDDNSDGAILIPHPSPTGCQRLNGQIVWDLQLLLHGCLPFLHLLPLLPNPPVASRFPQHPLLLCLPQQLPMNFLILLRQSQSPLSLIALWDQSLRGWLATEQVATEQESVESQETKFSEHLYPCQSLPIARNLALHLYGSPTLLRGIAKFVSSRASHRNPSPRA